MPFIKDDIFCDNNFKNNSSDFAGIIIEVEGTGPELIDISMGPILGEFSVIEISRPFSKFSI
tara:strand:- start:564 stop:749 length:186 start_codon:yes stop_codon:yes gene_type:complete